MKKIEDNKLAQDFVSYVACQASKNPNLHGFSSIKESYVTWLVKHQRILCYMACQASKNP